MKKMKERIIAFLCIVCITFSLFPEGIVTLAGSEADITLENAPEKDFASWTFEDAGLADNPGFSSSLNWNEFATEAAGAPLDKTIFHGKVNLDDVSSFGLFVIGGNYATEASKNRGFRFESYGTTDSIALGFWGPDGYFYNANGNTGKQTVTEESQVAIFNPTTAKTTLRGNSDLHLALSVEYISEVTDGKVDIKVGVFFDGKLYDNTYYTIAGIPEAFLRQNIRFNMSSAVSGVSNAIASYSTSTPTPPEPPVEKEDVYLKDAPEKNFTCWTFDDFGTNDQYLSVNLNWEDNWKENTLSNSLDKTIFNGLVNFPADTENFGNFYLGGASQSEESKWRGLVFVANNSTDKLGFGFMGPEGMFFNKYGNTGSGAMSGLLATFDPEVAGTTLRGNDNLQISMSVEYLSTTDSTADLKVGVFFDGKLYDGKYFTIKEVPLEYLNQNLRFYAVGSNVHIASQHLCDKAKQNDIPSADVYEEITLHDFSILDKHTDSIEEGKDFRAENYRAWKTLDNTAVSVMCNFPKEGTARFSVGGSFWRGIYVGSCMDGRIEVCYVNAAGELTRLTFLDAKIAGVDTLRGKALNIRLTFDIQETSDTMCDFKLGIYINNKLYNGQHYIVRNAELETLTQTFKIYATYAPFSVKSVETTPDLSIYGFDNKTWKKDI